MTPPRHNSLAETGVAPGALNSPCLQALRAWQSARLKHTHDDLYQNPETRPAMVFFLSDIYGPGDFSGRDEALARVYPIMARVLSGRLMETLDATFRLNRLSAELDVILASHLPGDIQQSADIGEADYAAAYRGGGHRNERKEQLALITALGEDLARAAGSKKVGIMLRMARKPARLGGFDELQDFLERGYQAFSHIGDPTHVVHTIVHRERHIMQRLFEGHPKPFEWHESLR